jgi:hypothetical protein
VNGNSGFQLLYVDVEQLEKSRWKAAGRQEAMIEIEGETDTDLRSK